MRFTELLNRLTGISCPVFGVSWNPVDTERSIARRIIIFLEPRRVLYSAYDYESVCPCITSVTDIKNYLTSELQNIDEQSELNAYVRSMRNACNKFLSKCPDKKEFRCYACQPGNIDNWILHLLLENCVACLVWWSAKLQRHTDSMLRMTWHR